MASIVRRLDAVSGSRAFRFAAWHAARVHRTTLGRTLFIGITGSAGKTMTKLLAADVLSTKYRGSLATGTRNNAYGAALSLIRRARRNDEFHVVELSAGGPGVLEKQVHLVRPRIGVVTNIGTDHYAAFGSREGIAAEKGKLVRLLPPDGVAILNADDPLVLDMAKECRARVLTYGESPDAMVRATNIVDAWPDPLRFDVTYEGRTVRVETRMFGTQWVTSALAAIATGLALDVSLEAGAKAIARSEPNPGRMSPVFLPRDIVCMRDDWKASVHTIPPALEFLQRARAKRKIAIIGTISDTSGNAGLTYVEMARMALNGADLVCFVGPRSFAAMRAQPADAPHRLRAFATVKAANDFLRSFVESGDLILLKGSNQADHLYRLVLSLTQEVLCWRTDCGRKTSCDHCELLQIPAKVSATPAADGPAAEPEDVWVPQVDRDHLPQVVIGLGNPGEHRRDTPHNVGFGAVDLLADTLQAEWRTTPQAAIAVAEWDGQPIWLLKPATAINHSGRALHTVLHQAGLRPEQCLLIYDDLDLPLGSVRTRQRGSDGGHRGVRSILEAFQTDQFRRVKIGVKRPGDASAAKEAVLRPFDAQEQAVVAASLTQAAERIRDLVVPKKPRAAVQ